MRIRIISSVVMLPMLFFFIIYGGLPLKIATVIVTLMGLYEFYRAFQQKFQPVFTIGFVFGLTFVWFSDFFLNQNNMLNAFISIFVVVLLFAMVVFHNHVTVKDVMVTFFGFFYVPFLLSHIYLIRESDYGNVFVWLIFICAFGCDTGAYFTGMLFGKHKLCPTLSPKKTIEGAIGGVVVATIMAVLLGVYAEKTLPLENVNSILVCFIIGVLGSILSQIGDLAASAIKRTVNIKDYGHLIPGHGGVLDRFDSVIFTTPVVYYVMFFLIEVNK